MVGGKHSKATNNGKSFKKDSSSGSGPRPYNNYNLYFLLERELFLQERGVYPSTNHAEEASTLQRSSSAGSHVDYSGIDLPPLPSRYSALVLPDDWYVHKKKRRAHVKTHGLISFCDMASMVGARWKQEDNDIRLFLKTVSEKVKQRFEEHKLYSYAVEAMNPTVVRSDLFAFKNKVLEIKDRDSNDKAKKYTADDDSLSLLVAKQVKQTEDEEELRKVNADENDHSDDDNARAGDWMGPPPIEIPSNQEIFHMMTNFLQDVPPYNGQPGICLCVSVEQTRRRSSPISELNLSDDEILKMWSSEDF
ncbi:hypothetical protein ACHAXR_007885 [Thalassiosira sp. AJA248-18]